MQKLSTYIPKEATLQINNWLKTYNCQLKIKKPRQTKLGDYRCPQNGKGHIISINNNLNPYAFLITLTHEIAHMMVWEKHQNKVLPHGSEWKEMFQKLMLNFLPLFPQDVLTPLAKHLKNPKASSSQDVALGKFLEHFTDYPYTHLDIAGPAFMLAPFNYRGKGGTGVGVRLLFNFLKKKSA